LQIIAFFSYCLDAVTSLSENLQLEYKATRFITDKNAWPPQQSKHFTTLAFIYHKNEYSQEDVITLATASHTGDIDGIMDTGVLEDNFLKGSKVTKNISEWLAVLKTTESSHPNTILIQGAPGMGKSFLLKHIAYLWANKILLTSSQLLFLIYLRNPAVQKISSINDLVDHFCNVNSGEVCVNYLHKTGGKNVTILLDGLDEFPEEMLLDDNCFITKLLEHRTLPACNVVVSSRPHASKHIRDNVKLRVDILGFSEEDRDSFIKQSLEGDDKSAERLLKYLHEHPTINSLCYVPFIMTVLLFLYKKGFKLFNSSAELYSQFVSFTIKHHLTRLKTSMQESKIDLNNLPSTCNDIITSLSKLSLEALSKGQLVFNLDEVKKACPGIDITCGINGFGLLQAVEYCSASHTSVSVNFIHFSIQEFLAAHCVANLPPDEEMKVLENHFWSKSHLNMFSLYVGLTKGQRSAFKQFLSDNGKEMGIAKKFLTEQTTCLYLYQCFYEAGDEEACRNIADAEVFSNRAIKMRGSLLPTDVTTLSLFLSSSYIKQWKTLVLLSCNIRDIGCRIFHHAIISHSTPIIIENINLSSNLLTSASARYISEIVIACKTKVLHLNGNNLQKTDALSNMLLKSSKIEELYIHGNKLHSSTAISLFRALKNGSQLKVLSLMYNAIEDEASDEMANALKVNKSLDTLWMNSNPLNEKAALKIVQALNSNSTLRVLILPIYSYEATKHIQKERNTINNNRKKNYNKIELDIDFQ